MRRILAGVLKAAGIAAILGISALAIFFCQPYGERQWISLALAAMMVGLIPALRRKRTESIATVPGVVPSAPRFLRLTGTVLFGVLGGWLVLIGWSAMSPGGPMPPGEVATGDRARRHLEYLARHRARRAVEPFRLAGAEGALEHVLQATAPEILCVQEALDDQVSNLANLLSGYGRVGVGRDDGRSAGEFCAVFFDRAI